MKILDLDMDYFMDSVAHTPDSVLERLSEADYGDCVWSERRVRSFLEENLGLSKERKLPGRIVCGHNEALIFWRELIAHRSPPSSAGMRSKFSSSWMSLADIQPFCLAVA